MKTLLWLTLLPALGACGGTGVPSNVAQPSASAAPVTTSEPIQSAVREPAPPPAPAVPSPEGEWEEFSNGSVGLGKLTIRETKLIFAKAGSGTLVARNGYFEVNWTDPVGPEIPCGPGDPAQVVQLTVKPNFLSASKADVLEIAFFSLRQPPAADRSHDVNLCEIQSWARDAAR